ncbi:MAG: CinA family nicotinamide mononucleotide deamidase-related protein [Flavobacteriaceae bacterium]|nr:CinA family nicotinamide mononucleotide deamidase-related protein [Flavobacteriaceae bacterium]
MNAEIIAIGDEILIGQIVDTNSQWIAKELNKIGVSIRQVKAIQDTEKVIEEAITDALRTTVDIVILTGGLGPTKDDVTKQAICNCFGVEMHMDPDVFEANKRLLEPLNYEYTKVIQQQALVPSNAVALINKVGTAPGLWIAKGGQVIVALPGVPSEMKGLMLDKVLPKIQDSFVLPHIVHRTLMTYGMGESKVAARISDWEEALPSVIKLAYLPSFGALRLRLSAKSKDKQALEKLVELQIEKLRPLLSDIFIGFEEEGGIEASVAKLLIENKQTLATAESCTGGNIAATITSRPGASNYYKGSIIAYTAQVKMAELGVSEKLITEHSVVSCEVSEAMARGIQKKFKSDYAIATTGNAGPTVDLTDKTVGVVCIAIATPVGVYSEEFNFGQPREKVILKASAKAFEMLRKEILKKDEKLFVVS